MVGRQGSREGLLQCSPFYFDRTAAMARRPRSRAFPKTLTGILASIALAVRAAPARGRPHTNFQKSSRNPYPVRPHRMVPAKSGARRMLPC